MRFLLDVVISDYARMSGIIVLSRMGIIVVVSMMDIIAILIMRDIIAVVSMRDIIFGIATCLRINISFHVCTITHTISYHIVAATHFIYILLTALSIITIIGLANIYIIYFIVIFMYTGSLKMLRVINCLISTIIAFLNILLAMMCIVWVAFLLLRSCLVASINIV